MAATTIEWTSRTLPDGRFVPGYSFNPWFGCTKVGGSPACDHCYAERDADTRRRLVDWGPESAGGTRRLAAANTWNNPLRWAREAEKNGVRPLVFVASWGDVFEAWAGPMVDSDRRVVRTGGTGEHVWRGVEPLAEYDPAERAGSPGNADRPVTMAECRERLFRLIATTSYGLDWLVLTKRADDMARQWDRLTELYGTVLTGLAKTDFNRYQKPLAAFKKHDLMATAWAGVTAESQEWWDRRVNKLAVVNAARRFVSVEPMTGDIDPGRALRPANGSTGRPGIHWVIAGGESGPGARPAPLDWYRGLRDRCAASETAFFFKQHGETIEEADPVVASTVVTRMGTAVAAGQAGTITLPVIDAHGRKFVRLGRADAGRDLDGVKYDQIPASLISLGV